MSSDPWRQARDLDGLGLYTLLGLSIKATSADVKKAYRSLAKKHHPDRGGTAVEFTRLQHAFEVLSDPRQREVYDTWAKELQFRYVRSNSSQAAGGEDLLLDEFEGLGLHCDPQTQLVVTCEVCRRPATKECWTCGMKICEFCTLKRHWKGSFPLHWPLVNSNHMRTKLAKRELERKRIEDDHQLALEDHNFRTETQLKTIRSFRDAAHRMSQQKNRQVTYSLELAQLYMWAQTDQYIFLAVHVPTGYEDQEVHLECNEHNLLLQPHNSPPVIDRLFGHAIDCHQPVETFRSQDKTLFVTILHKGKPGQKWQHMFRGDPDGVRCMQPIYNLTESADDVLLEIQVPFWIDADDVRVDIGEQQLHVYVRNTFCFCRTYWTNREHKGDHKSSIDVDESSWVLDEDSDGSNDSWHSLMICLARPAVTSEEEIWKKGKRQDNRTQQRSGSMHLKGYRFFADDEDTFGLENILQALMFMKTGSTPVPAKPWQQGIQSKVVSQANLLSKEAQSHLAQMCKSAKEA
ncbi:hypothetical protein WJX82_005130 [Trebouxia sp. C0006]